MTLREKAQWFNDNSITPSMLPFSLSDIILLLKNGYKITQQDAENFLRASGGNAVAYKQLMEGAGLPTPKILPTINFQEGSFGVGFTIDDIKRYQNEYGVDVAIAGMDRVPYIPKAATGAVLSGPDSGYPAILHGTEAVVPLPDGRSIPVDLVIKQNTQSAFSMLEKAQEIQSDMIEKTMTRSNQISGASNIVSNSGNQRIDNSVKNTYVNNATRDYEFVRYGSFVKSEYTTSTPW
ncbi:hypothetical protein EB118_11290 [bacterium]|nr:hypothetical protein [bacterium]